MNHKKVRFLHDHQSPYSGNEFYKRGTTATFRDSAAAILVNGGHAEYTDKPKQRAEATPAPAPLTAVKGVTDALSGELQKQGIKTIADLAIANVAQLTPIKGVGKVKANALIDAARQYVEVVNK